MSKVNGMNLLTEKEIKLAENPSDGDFIFPANSKYVNDEKGHYPIQDEAHGKNALARGSQQINTGKAPVWFNGTLKEFSKKLVNTVKKRYPSIKIDEDKFLSDNQPNGGDNLMTLDEIKVQLEATNAKVVELTEKIDKAKDKDKDGLASELKNLVTQKELLELKEQLTLSEKTKDEAAKTLSDLKTCVETLKSDNEKLREKERFAKVDNMVTTLVAEGHYPAFADKAKELVLAYGNQTFEIKLSDTAGNSKTLTNMIDFVLELANAVPAQNRVDLREVSVGTGTPLQKPGGEKELDMNEIEKALRAAGAVTKKMINEKMLKN